MGAKYDVSLVLIELKAVMSQPVFNVLETVLKSGYISLILRIEGELDLSIICITVKRDVMSLNDSTQWELVKT